MVGLYLYVCFIFFNVLLTFKLSGWVKFIVVVCLFEFFCMDLILVRFIKEI